MGLFQQEVKKRIGPYMKQKGFKIRNRTYYYIYNNIAYCITFEQPTGVMYTIAHVNPLFMPDESMHISFGNRLSDISDIALPTLSVWSDQAEIGNWCTLFFRSMDDHILPFFQKNIDTPEKLVAYVEQPGGCAQGKMFWCSTHRIEELKIYTYLFLCNYEKVASTLDSYRAILLKSNFVSSLKDELLSKANEIETLISKGHESASDFCNRTMENTKKLFQKTSKK